MQSAGVWPFGLLTTLLASPLNITKQVMGVQQVVGDLRAFFQAAADGGGNGLAGFATKAGELIDLDLDTAHAAYFVKTGRDGNAYAELFVDAPLQFFQIGQALEVFQALQQAFFLGAGEQQDAHIAAGILQQLLTPAVAGTGWAGLAQGWCAGHGFRS